MDLAELARLSLAEEPYQWGFLPEAFPIDLAARLLATFPRQGYWRLTGRDEEKSWTYSARPLVTLDAGAPAFADSLVPEWRQVAETILSRRYRDALGATIGRDLAGMGVEASVWRWDTGTNLGAHRDMATKIVTQVFYFNVGWRPEWGGCLRILRSAAAEDLVAELPPRLGSSSVLVRSDSSWHSVTPVAVAAPGPRLSLIVTWFRPGADSPVWRVQDGRITSVATGEPIDEVAARG